MYDFVLIRCECHKSHKKYLSSLRYLFKVSLAAHDRDDYKWGDNELMWHLPDTEDR